MSTIWNKDDITISTIDKEDIKGILKCFEENGPIYKDINSASPSRLKSELEKVMNQSLDGTDNTNAILVIKRNDTIIGFMRMYVEYGITYLADVVLNSDKQTTDSSVLLTKECITIAKAFAVNDHRTFRIYRCFGSSNRILDEYWLGPTLNNAGFTHIGNNLDSATIFEYRPEKDAKTTPGLPSLFPSIKEYEKMAAEKSQKRVDDFVKFLNSSTGEFIAKSLGLKQTLGGIGIDD